MASKMRKLLRDPVGVIKRRVFPESRMYASRNDRDYDASRYWDDRLSKYGDDLRGVGICDISHEENEATYRKARETFLSVLDAAGVNIPDARVLEVGCGTGFYTGILKDMGAENYVGLDITDANFLRLRHKYPEYSFRKHDVTEGGIEGSYDLIVMIDVTQHITSDEKFEKAMQDIGAHLEPEGVFIVTSWLQDKARRSFYEMARPLKAYEDALKGYVFSEPVPFRDKFLFTVRKDGATPCESVASGGVV